LILALVPPDAPTDGEIIREDELVWVSDIRQPLKLDPLSLVLAPNGCMYRSRVIEKLKQQTHAWKISYTNADLFGLIAAIQQGLGITALAKSSVPTSLSVIQHPALPYLGKIKIALFDYDTQHPEVSKTLSDFIRMRLSG
jgi:DNA-binding transcriptional LysR family regulator